MCDKQVLMMIPLAVGDSFGPTGAMQIKTACGSHDYWGMLHLCKRCKGNKLAALQAEERKLGQAAFLTRKMSKRAMHDARNAERAMKRRLGRDYE